MYKTESNKHKNHWEGETLMKKILTIMALLILCTGICFAANIDDVKLPDGFNKQSDHVAKNDKYELSINKYAAEDKDILFTNGDGYNVITGDINKYTDKQVKHEGCFEIVEINGEKTVVEIYYDGLSNQDKCFEYLQEFNKLNNLKPIEV